MHILLLQFHYTNPSVRYRPEIALSSDEYRAVTADQSPTMSYVAKGEKEYDATGAPVPAPKIHKIRITLTSSNVKNLEKCAWRPLDVGRDADARSLRGPHQPREGQAAPRQGPRSPPHQGPQDHHP